MKKPASDQQSHVRRYEERKRAEAARKPLPKKVPSSNPAPLPAGSASSK